MNYKRRFTGIAGVVLTLLFATINLAAQNRQMTLPSGTVLELRMESGLNSDTSHVNDTFTAVVSKSVWIDGSIGVPENSTVQGRVTSVQPAERREPGVIGVAFDRLTVNGRTYTIDGTLTSLQANERKQILDEESRVQGGSSTKRDVMFIGGGAGAGAAIGAIAGGGKGAGIGALTGGALGALGALLSPGADAKVPVGSDIAMQLMRPVTVTTVAAAARSRGYNDRSVYTSANMVRAAQQALRQRNYYSGSTTGTLDDPTRRAIAHFQIDNNQPTTGDLDEGTATALGLLQGGALASDANTRQIALDVSRKATSLLTLYEDSLGVRVANVRAGSRLTESDLGLLLDVSSFVTAASWFEQASRTANNANQISVDTVGRILARAARNVDAGIDTANESIRFRDAWAGIRNDLRQLRLDGRISSSQ